MGHQMNDLAWMADHMGADTLRDRDHAIGGDRWISDRMGDGRWMHEARSEPDTHHRDINRGSGDAHMSRDRHVGDERRQAGEHHGIGTTHGDHHGE